MPCSSITRAWAAKAIARGAAGNELLLHRCQRFLRGSIHGEVMLRRLADDEGAHEGRVIMPVNASPFERELVALAQRAAARLVAASSASLSR